MRTILILLAGMLVLLAAMGINESPTSQSSTQADHPATQMEMADK